MPNRILRDDIHRSDRIDKLSGEAEAFYYRLMVAADDLGRFDAHSASIGTKCYPLRVPPVTRMASFAEFMGKIEALLKELVDAKLVFLYDVGNERFGVFYKWKQRLRIMKKKFPDPPESVLAECAPDDSHNDGHTVRQGDGVNPNPNPKKNPKPKPEMFLAFWEVYPRKEGKIPAEESFNTAMQQSEDQQALLDTMLASLARQKRSQQWTRDRGMFIPHASTWLNQKRWLDEGVKTLPGASPPVRKPDTGWMKNLGYSETQNQKQGGTSGSGS